MKNKWIFVNELPVNNTVKILEARCPRCNRLLTQLVSVYTDLKNLNYNYCPRCGIKMTESEVAYK